MPKIKLAVIVIFLSFAGFALTNSEQLITSAKTDFVQEIANYKTWSKITKKPIKTEFTIDNASGGG